MGALSCLYKFYKNYNGKKGTVGVSTQGRIIPYFLVEKTAFPTIIIQYSIHAREYITTYLALKQIKEFNKRASFGRVFFIPMLNPDGVNIATHFNPLYKANARGVDLNVNFDARWGTGAQNVFVPGSENYVGEYPFSEPETVALRDFTLNIKPDLTLSYHCKGEEIYWEFLQDEKQRERDYKFAKALSQSTGYPLVTPNGSAGGYKDWCIEKLKIPALTIEVGKDSLSHPLSDKHLPDVYEKNKNALLALTEISLWI
jgi:g-D-glutamyl-meso-diaminopimelate peptidase